MCLPLTPVPPMPSLYEILAEQERLRIKHKWSDFKRAERHCPNCGAPYTNDSQCDYCETPRHP